MPVRSVEKDREFRIDRLESGGLITNYYCTSRCAHCLYGCSPSWKKSYIEKGTVRANLEKIRALGCSSIHVGGGESFLDEDGLRMVVETAGETGVDIEYVETNSSWYRGLQPACKTLSSLKERGLNALLVSMSPFHNEYTPLFKVKGVMEACRSVGMNVFPWIWDFYSEMEVFDERLPHSLLEYRGFYGTNFLGNIPSRYWVHLGGRAIETFESVFGTMPLKDILGSSRGGCTELLDVTHFHMDLFGRYIPGLCSGLSIERQDLGGPLSQEKYPFLYTLFRHGISGFLDVASGEYGFHPAAEYLNKCHLCLEIRRCLVLENAVEAPELRPREFYENV